DLAGVEISRVRAPTLLIVDDTDVDLPEANRQALRALSSEKVLEVVASACLEHADAAAAEQGVVNRAQRWFVRHLEGAAMPERDVHSRSDTTVTKVSSAFAPKGPGGQRYLAWGKP